MVNMYVPEPEKRADGRRPHASEMGNGRCLSNIRAATTLAAVSCDLNERNEIHGGNGTNDFGRTVTMEHAPRVDEGLICGVSVS
jgi:hypothetical protein